MHMTIYYVILVFLKITESMCGCISQPGEKSCDIRFVFNIRVMSIPGWENAELYAISSLICLCT